MFKAFLRAIGYLVTGLAFAVLFVDGVRSIARDNLVFTPLENFWRLMDAGSLLSLRRSLAGLEGSQDLVAAAFALPAALWLLVLGMIFSVLGRKRRLIAPEARTK